MSALLEIQNLSKAFGGLRAINKLSFEVAQGEILGFIGPNGAGKTTAFNTIMGVYKPDAGRIFFNGKDISSWRTYQIVNLGIARTFQIPKPFQHKTVFENIEISTIANAIFSKDHPEARRDLVLRAAEMVGLKDALLRLPGTLPQAGLRRLEIAKAIATEPELLLLDEPFAGLNMAEVEELSALIRKLREDGHTVVIVDHNMRGLMKLVDRVVVINFGEKLAEGNPDEVSQNKDVQDAYLAGGGI